MRMTGCDDGKMSERENTCKECWAYLVSAVKIQKDEADQLNAP